MPDENEKKSYESCKHFEFHNIIKNILFTEFNRQWCQYCFPENAWKQKIPKEN